MFCKYCGNRLEDGDRFCGACGHPVEEKPMQETANDGCTRSAASGKQPVSVYQEFEKAA